MNRSRMILVFGVAILLALLASVGVYKFLSERSRVAEQARLQTVGIVVAVVDIPVGGKIDPNQVAVSAWPKENYPKDSFPDMKAVVGRVARRDFLRGEPIVDSKLVPMEKGSGLLSLLLPAGMRAFSVRVNEVVGVGGFIVPDSRVDVLVTIQPGQRSERISKIVLENIQVIAAGQAVEQKDNKPITVNTVTLAVTPEEAEKLALASNEGIIQLVMRNFMDADNVVTVGANKARLLSAYRPSGPSGSVGRSRSRTPARVVRESAPPPPVVQRHTVEVLRGNKRSEEKFTE